MKLKDALKRIEELERKVKELESRPVQQFHYHYQAPTYAPQTVPLGPWWTGQPMWCSSGLVASASGESLS